MQIPDASQLISSADIGPLSSGLSSELSVSRAGESQPTTFPCIKTIRFAKI